MAQTPDYLIIGHVTKDLMPDGSYRVGGTATYVALTVARLGASVAVLTSAHPGFRPLQGLDSIVVRSRPARRTTTFENIYGSGARRQYVRSVAAHLVLSDVPICWGRAPIVHLAPVAQEVDSSLVARFPRALIGITPQGWLRSWNQEGAVRHSCWSDAQTVLPRASATVLSIEDLGGDAHLLAQYCRFAKLLVLTVGRKGAIVYHEGGCTRLPAYRVNEVDPTGAGDVFAAAFFLRYAESRDCLDAARFANCVASFVVEGAGATNLPTREQVEERLMTGRLRE